MSILNESEWAIFQKETANLIGWLWPLFPAQLDLLEHPSPYRNLLSVVQSIITATKTYRPLHYTMLIQTWWSKHKFWTPGCSNIKSIQLLNEFDSHLLSFIEFCHFGVCPRSTSRRALTSQSHSCDVPGNVNALKTKTPGRSWCCCNGKQDGMFREKIDGTQTMAAMVLSCLVYTYMFQTTHAHWE